MKKYGLIGKLYTNYPYVSNLIHIFQNTVFAFVQVNIVFLVQEIEKFVYFLQANTLQWTESISLNVPRFLCGATVLRSPGPDNKKLFLNEVIFVAGGVGSEGILSSVEVS